MEEDDLPKEFDLVVIGTGFSESIVAAAASRVGKTVLHLDPNGFYGGVWSSFNLEAFLKFFETCAVYEPNPSENLAINENYGDIKSIKQNWHIDDVVVDPEVEVATEDATTEWTKEKVLKEFRKFNIDLSPKLLFANGKLVDLLITSNICRYAEFRSVDRISTLMNDEIKNVPCSRSDVFNTKDVNIVEKRLLMKLLTTCMSYEEHPEEFVEYEGKTFLEYLKGNKLTENIIHYVLYAISMSNDETSLKDGMERTKKFLASLGRYGNTPFLFPMYGCGEIPQCFCRLCAVFGGIYCLKRPIENIVIDKVENDEKTKLVAIKCGKQEIKVKNLVIGCGNIPKSFKSSADNISHNENQKCGNLSRAIFITSTPLGDEELNAGGGGVNILKLQGDGLIGGAFVIQLSHYSGTCPKGLYLIHMTCQSKTDNAENDLKKYTEKIFNEKASSPKIIYSVYFQIPNCGNCKNSNDPSHSLPNNIYTTCGPYFELDYDLSIENARELFTKIYPDETFLPRAPDPEEIVMHDEDPEAVRAEEVTEASIAEHIKELQEGIENEVKCMEENSRNEIKDCTPTEE